MIIIETTDHYGNEDAAREFANRIDVYPEFVDVSVSRLGEVSIHIEGSDDYERSLESYAVEMCQELADAYSLTLEIEEN